MVEKTKKSSVTRKATAKSVTTKTEVNASRTAPRINPNKLIFFGIIIAAVIAVVIGVCIAINLNQPINDAYFVSDDSKYVLNMKNDEADNHDVIAIHAVYYYSGDTVTGAKSFYEFEDEETAKTTYEKISPKEGDTNTYSLNGKYVVITAGEDTVKKINLEDIKTQIELYEALERSAGKESAPENE